LLQSVLVWASVVIEDRFDVNWENPPDGRLEGMEVASWRHPPVGGGGGIRQLEVLESPASWRWYPQPNGGSGGGIRSRNPQYGE